MRESVIITALWEKGPVTLPETALENEEGLSRSTYIERAAMKRLLISAIISLMLIIIVILAGIYLSPYPQDQSLALQLLHRQSDSGISRTGLDHDQNSRRNITEHPILDGQLETAILLEMSLPQLGEQVDFALTTQAIEFELSKYNKVSDHLTCSEESATVSPRQATAPLIEMPNQTSYWKRLVNWANLSSFAYQYQVVLWPQSNQAEQYVLAEHSPQDPMAEFSPITVICQDRT